MKDCQKCKTYKDCPGKNWYHYGEIRWCPYQVIWIIEQSEILSSGAWPSPPNGSSYVDPSIHTAFKSEAYYVKPEEILSEVEKRLKRVFRDPRYALLDEVKNGMGFAELSRPARDALMYVKGFKRKRISFKYWRRKKNGVFVRNTTPFFLQVLTN